ncbi:phosphate ABC transporter permease PstA [Clostridium senegalense]|uniref:Phosphate transport system permease protein PstA n=1 Tax=Clostridium senegalense TaxID=1465809 RepID=A0A6M0H1G3_9CLOT|nr:phosphate ABC transporter permease PstA [Clostridium senegalense]NEU04014.1 phosphate ABC transporter permease PstA [Clostridium senegalense]
MRKIKGFFLNSLLWLSAILTVIILGVILIFIFTKGIGVINFKLLFSNYSSDGQGGLLPMIITTLYTVGLSLLVGVPIGILSAIYLQEYAKQGIIVKFIRFSTEVLAGIPSIIYGLFGSIFFVTILKMGYSILAASLTLAIIILPVIIRTTEESLKTVPSFYKEGSLALGATKFQTLYKVVLPAAMPGILSGVILSIGRIIGESAAILLTAGTAVAIPENIMSSARTLTVHAYLVTKEQGDIGLAAAIGIVLIVMVLVLNLLSQFIVKRFTKGNY